MTTPLSVPGTLHTPPTDSYYQEMSQQQQHHQQQQQSTHSPQVNHINHSLNLMTSQPNNSHVTVATANPFSPHMSLSPVPSHSSTTPMSPAQVPVLSQSLNPAAPQFVPLPVSGHGSSNGLLMTPSVGGFHQSTAMYVMGSQQMVYTQSHPEIVGSGFGHGKYQGGQVQYQGGSSPHYRQQYNSRNSYY